MLSLVCWDLQLAPDARACNQEERESLQDEIAALESRLAVLKKRAGIAEGASGMGLEAKAVNNAVLRGMIHQQQMVLANAQSMMAKSVVSP